MNAGRRVVGVMNGIARNKGLSRKACLAIYHGILVPTFMYGSETWIQQRKHKSRITAVEMQYLRAVCKKT